MRKSCWNSWGITEGHSLTECLRHWPRLFWDGEQLSVALRGDVTAVAWLMNLAWSLSWFHHYSCLITHEFKVNTVLCKLHQEIVPTKRSAHVVGHSGGFMLERCWCRRARGNRCKSEVSRLSLSYSCAREKGVAVIFAFPLPAHALNPIPIWHNRAPPVLFLGMPASGEIILWSLLNCRYSITMHRERLFTLRLCRPICVSVMKSHTQPCAVCSKCSISCKSFPTANTGPASFTINCP